MRCHEAILFATEQWKRFVECLARFRVLAASVVVYTEVIEAHGSRPSIAQCAEDRKCAAHRFGEANRALDVTGNCQM